MDTIVVGVDDSTGARAALAWAAREASATAGQLRVIHAYELNIAWIDGYNPDIERWERHAQDSAQATLERVAAAVLNPSQREHVRLEAVEGRADEVLRSAGSDASLVVVGSRGRGGFAGLLLGSVSQRLAQRAPCPVVIVPPPDDLGEAASR